MNKFFKKIIFVKLLAIIFFFFSANCGNCSGKSRSSKSNECHKITSDFENLSVEENLSLFDELSDDLLNITLYQNTQDAANLSLVCQRWNDIIQPTIFDFSKYNDELKLIGNELTNDNVISVIKVRPYLRFINLNFCSKITDISVIALAKKCPNLQLILLACCWLVSKETVIALRKKYPKLEIVG